MYEGEMVLAEQADQGAGDGSDLQPRDEITQQKGELIKNFLGNNASQLTIYGLFCLQEGLKERELCVFFRNNHFSTMFKLRKFNPLVIPKSLQAALPFASKPKDRYSRKRPLLESRRAVVMEPHERKVHALVQHLQLIRNEKMKKRKLKEEEKRNKHMKQRRRKMRSYLGNSKEKNDEEGIGNLIKNFKGKLRFHFLSDYLIQPVEEQQHWSSLSVTNKCYELDWLMLVDAVKLP
ncbi:ubiquitin carboxyl-terminal hydrolase MIY1-like [Macadamia integrifolia]|uniref:ubiquitin carboxyl-terminal hydrolase MIY1-like n=1 Tax=Macadamia integrifolia TaxID=60698 RepID=UPI001C4EF572|nr:ubiquitin carboxyl-terminal hydrolase MIY1-like [Macadamia integrifolia]XP_042488105.1 ubiquitin carboxyl-terminal hydrolase MIY1-like [Macadamia integrifolia]XP_042488106.1 ubiquitin carboxyl-terminal hydrolase MIY1-like [Macadamia integrifolia]